jgi:hypothetical protein
MSVDIPTEVLGRLRAAKTNATRNEEIQASMAARDEVLARYSLPFQPAAIHELPEETLRSFLYFENNKHWTGLNRQVNRICADMVATRLALAALVDESLPLETRMEQATAIKGMGKGIITAILHVAYPDRYGVWNSTSDAALIELGLMPTFPRGARFGERYAAINQVLRQVAPAIEVDLWTLDFLWWTLSPDESDRAHPEELEEVAAAAPGFGGGARSFALERHLHDYLFDNWANLSLAADWEIYTRPGEPEAGYELVTPIGRIDLLARHRREPRWLVIELKRQGSSDQVVGQVLRYIGWIKAHQAEPGESVEGLIVAHEGDARLQYAVLAVPNLSFKCYEVEFRLKDGPSFEQFARP